MTISLQSQGRVLQFDVTQGEAVKAGQPLLEFSVSESALGSYRQAETALQTAKVERVRIAQLLRQQLATKDQLTQADKAIADAETTLDTLKKSGSDQPNLTIKAPFDGVVSTIPVAQGDTIAPGAPMMTLMRVDGLVVTVGIEPAQRFRLKRGDPAILQPLTSGGAPESGTLVRIDGLLNPKTHLIDADVATSARLLPGAAFMAQITVGQFDGFIVPRDVVLSDAEGAYLFQTDAGKAHRVVVTIVGNTGDQSAVIGAIDPAKPIVLQGNYQLEDGMEVRLGETQTSAAGPAAPGQQ
jgi:membrane fusion protein, multidrug efflux system